MRSAGHGAVRRWPGRRAAFTLTEGQLDTLDDLVAVWTAQRQAVIDRLLGRG